MLVDFKLPDLGENIDSGDVVKLMVKVGDVLAPDQPVMELETGKAVLEVPSNVSGRVAAILVAEGDKVTVGQSVLRVDDDLNADISAIAASPKADQPSSGDGAKAAAQVVSTPATAPIGKGSVAASRAGSEIPAAPGARRMARELGVDLGTVRGSGPDGWITEEDVRARAAKPATSPAVTSPNLPGAPTSLPDFARWGEIERKAMSSVRVATAEHMVHAWTTIPQVTQYDHADITDLNALRKRYASTVEAAGGKLTVTAVLVKVVASALRQFPRFNSSVDMPRREIIQKRYINVGVAVATERGLLVPVIRDADEKNILELSVELARITDKAHKRELKPADLEGGTFSITNLGTVGGTHFTPIVNWPEVSILGISKSAMEPVWREDRFDPRLLLPLSLSYDHRVIDGAEGARFLRWICEALEQPFFLALEG